MLKVWDTATGKEIRTIKDPGPSNQVPVMAVTPDGKTVWTWVYQTTIESYDLENGKQRDSWTGSESQLTSLSFSPDGELAALGGLDGSVRIWNVSKKAKLLTKGDQPLHQESIVDLVFTPDKKFLVTAGKDGLVKVWNVKNLADNAPGKATAVRSFAAHKTRIIALAMSPDGKRFVSAGADNTVKLWDTATGEEKRKWEFRVPVIPNKAFLRNIAFTPDGKHVVTANYNTTMYLLELP